MIDVVATTFLVLQIREAYVVCMSHLKRVAITEQLYRALEQEMQAMEDSLGYRRRLLAHRHYLEHDASHGTPSQRQRQAAQSRLNRAVDSVYDRQFQNALTQSSGLTEAEPPHVSVVVDRHHKRALRKSSAPLQRIADERIVEEMNTGGFKSIRGKGAPLRNEPATHVLENLDEKLNKVLINSGCAPDWIALDKEIRGDVERLKADVRAAWVRYNSSGQTQRSVEEQWEEDGEKFRERMTNINDKIRKLNFDVPSLHMQRVPLKHDRFIDRIIREAEPLAHQSSQDGNRGSNDSKQPSQSGATDDLPPHSAPHSKHTVTESPVFNWISSLIQRFING